MNAVLNVAVAALAATLLLSSGQVLSGDGGVGRIKFLKGEALATSQGQDVKLESGTLLTSGDVLKTGAGASLGVLFKDNTVMTLGPGSELVIDDYAYSPGQGRLKLEATLRKGTLAYLAGAIAKLNPDAVSLKTPTGRVQVRGTHFVIKVDD